MLFVWQLKGGFSVASWYQDGLKQQEKEGKEEGFPGKPLLESHLSEEVITDIHLKKAKLKVGKAKAKAANFTDTSFKSKCNHPT